MDTHLLYELIGYTASLLVVISLMMRAIVKLRIVNMIGAFTFSIYGLLIESIPVAAMNGFIVLINIYFLIQVFRDKEYFQLLEVDPESSYTRKFLEFYRKHITTYQPSYGFDNQHNFSLFVLRDMVPAGLIQGNVDEEGVLAIDLDYVIPNYRDFKIGKFLFNEKLDFFRSKNIQTIRASAGNAAHNSYLEKTGFTRTDAGNTHAYVLPLNPGE
ncbi:MAG: GNAT family N-acetyltransferase [Puniceicoccaceae bacterium]